MKQVGMLAKAGLGSFELEACEVRARTVKVCQLEVCVK